ncbi:hypothetical protein MAHJHV53_10020 [Mycobacterium avium subsp. hominissuis]
MRRFASTTAGVALLRPTAHHLDRLVAKATGGRSSFAGLATGIPVVMLTTTGAKSGEPRTVPVYGIPHPEGLALIASNFGGAKHPAWYFNLKAHPEATVTVGRDSWPATARLATPTSGIRSGPKVSSCIPVGENTRCGPAIATSRRSS